MHLLYDSAGSNCDAFRGKWGLQHSLPTDDYVLLLNKFSHLSGVILYACRKLDRHIDD